MEEEKGFKRMATVSILWALLGFFVYLPLTLSMPQYFLPFFLVCYGWLILGVVLAPHIVHKFWSD